MLEKWSNIAFQAFYQGLKGATDGLSDISELLDYRNKLLQTWLPVSVSTPTHSAPEVFEALRNVFNARLKDLLHDKASSLAAIASRIEMALEKDDPSTLVSFLSIWDQDFVTMPLGRGASSYKKQLIDRHLGQSKTTNNILSSLQKWTTTMFTSLERIQQLRKTRWIDLIEDDEDEDDDNSRIERIETTLQKVDPDQYEQEHSSSLRSATLEIQNKIKQVAENLPQNPNDEQVRKPIFLLRTFRAIHQHLATAFPQQDLAILNSAVLHLHRQLASNSATRLLDTIKPSTFGLKNQQIKHLTRLWSGEPTPLPTQPSPPILKCLYRLTGVMAEQGPDLWSTDAVDDVKRAVRNGLVNIELLRLTEAADLVNGNSNTITNGNGKDNTQTDDNNDGKHITDQGDRSIQTQTQIQIQIQNLFDLLYLSHALRIDSKSPAHSANTAMNADEDDPLTSLLRQSKHSLSAVSESTTLEIEARAKEYWARTRLLFGLLD